MNLNTQHIQNKSQLVFDLWFKMESIHDTMVTCRKLAQKTAQAEELEFLTGILYECEEMLRQTFSNLGDLLEVVKLGHLDTVWENKEEDYYD